MKKLFLSHASLCLSMLCASMAQAASDNTTWIDIDTRQQTLTVMDAQQRPIAQFDGISIGSGGVSDVHRQGDHSTPRGHFHVMSIRPSAKFDTFLLLDYPQLPQAELAMQQGWLSRHNRDEIAAAAVSGRLPPQDTPLGGAIGIHGLGRGSPDIQQRFNWTSGCVALTNRQIHRLADLAYPGMSVVIH